MVVRLEGKIDGNPIIFVRREGDWWETTIPSNLDGVYVIELVAKTTSAMDESQLTALVYRELRRIGPEGEILTPDVHDWWQILMGLGRKWFYPDSTCPNLLDDNVDWKKLMGTYYEGVRGND